MREISNIKAFTLVEIAIVMTIIGLLVGGVLKGQKMIENVKITRTIADLHSYKAAAVSFRDQFLQFPGDFSAARTRLPNCSVANECYNGVDDGRINPVVGPPWFGGDLAPTFEAEGIQFWKHLSVGGYITSVNAGATEFGGGESNPSNPIRGFYHVYFPTNSAFGDRLNGNILAIRKSLKPPYNNITTNPFTAYQMWQIDKKMDDGNGATGQIASEAVGGVNVGCDNDGTYHVDDRRTSCELYFYFLK